MVNSIEICPATTRRDRKAFTVFPWKVYQGDHNWVPPLISERLDYLDPAKGIFYKQADVALFMARREREVLRTIAAFVNNARVKHLGLAGGGFGFLEVVEEYEVAKQLLDACMVHIYYAGFLKQKSMELLRREEQREALPASKRLFLTSDSYGPVLRDIRGR
jgi:hypothetical protein